MSSTSQSNLTSAFIDLATYDIIEKTYLYESTTASSPFVKKIRSSSWFSVCPTILAKGSGQPNFGQTWCVNVSRAGDYLLNAWLRLKTPVVTMSDAKYTSGGVGQYKLRWTKNLMHALIKEAYVTFNDLVAFRLDNFFLDNWFQFTTPGAKRNGYENMIGNEDALTNYTNAGINPGKELPERVLNLPLPFGFTRHPGCSLPTAALPFNEIRIYFNFRNWDELLMIDDTTAHSTNVPLASELVLGAPVLNECNVWAEYGIVSADERKIMGSVARDMLIEQVQTTPQITWNPRTNSIVSADIRVSHAVKAIFFEVRNKTYKNQWSNYTAGSPVPSIAGVDFNPTYASDPILSTSLLYDNTFRLSEMGSDYFSLIQPWYHCNSAIPDKTGYHLHLLPHARAGRRLRLNQLWQADQRQYPDQAHHRGFHRRRSRWPCRAVGGRYQGHPAVRVHLPGCEPHDRSCRRRFSGFPCCVTLGGGGECLRAYLYTNTRKSYVCYYIYDFNLPSV